MTRQLLLLPLALAGTLSVAVAAPPAAGVTLRIATQAPEGTVWMDALMEIKATVAVVVAPRDTD